MSAAADLESLRARAIAAEERAAAAERRADIAERELDEAIRHLGTAQATLRTLTDDKRRVQRALDRFVYGPPARPALYPTCTRRNGRD